MIPLLDIGKPIMEVEAPAAHSTINITPPLSSFHYHVGNVGSLLSSLVTALNTKALFSLGDCHIMNNPSTRSSGRSFTRLHGWVLFIVNVVRAARNLIWVAGGPV